MTDFDKTYKLMLDAIVNGASLEEQERLTLAACAALPVELDPTRPLSATERNDRVRRDRYGDATPAERNARLVGGDR